MAEFLRNLTENQVSRNEEADVVECNGMHYVATLL